MARSSSALRPCEAGARENNALLPFAKSALGKNGGNIHSAKPALGKKSSGIHSAKRVLEKNRSALPKNRSAPPVFNSAVCFASQNFSSSE